MKQHWHRVLDIRLILGLILAVAAALFVLEANADNESVEGDTTFDRIDDYVSDQMNGSRIPGASIAIVEGGRVAHARGFGDDGNGNHVSAETPFWIGSNTKSFTALSIMQLAEAGRIDINAPVQRYLPEFQLSDAAASSSITVKHLLNQTSGFSRSDGLKAVLDENTQTLEQAVADLATVSLNRPVGESYEYSNLNFVVAGLLVERVSGQKWTEYVQENIFDPLQMTSSYTSLEAAKAAGLTATHTYLFGFAIETDGPYLPGIAPTGYLYSTAADMGRYLAMYLNGGDYGGRRLLSAAGIDAMLTAESGSASRPLMSHTFEFEYGRGWFVGAFGAADDARWHLGNLPYFTAWMVLLPETDQAVVVLINAGSQFEIAGANAVMSRIPIGIVNLLRDEPPPSGMSMTRFYILFDAAVGMIVAVQVWSLIRIGRRGAQLPAGLRASVTAFSPLAWELLLSLLLLWRFPAVFGAGWPPLLRSLPDLGVVVLVVAGLWLLSGLVRVALLARAFMTARAGQSSLHGNPGTQGV